MQDRFWLIKALPSFSRAGGWKFWLSIAVTIGGLGSAFTFGMIVTIGLSVIPLLDGVHIFFMFAFYGSIAAAASQIAFTTLLFLITSVDDIIYTAAFLKASLRRPRRLFAVLGSNAKIKGNSELFRLSWKRRFDLIS